MAGWAPPALPVWFVVPARRAGLARAHDLGTDPVAVTLGERVVNSGASPRVPERRDHPLVRRTSASSGARVGVGRAERLPEVIMAE